MKKILAEFLSWSKSQRFALIFLILVILLSQAGVYYLNSEFYRTYNEEEKILKSNFFVENTLDTFHNSSLSIPTKKKLFYFDPNTITIEEWQELGVSLKTAKTILKYIEHKGHFYKAEDLKKIYGMNEEKANELIPYVQFKKAKNKENQLSPQKIKPVDINTSNSKDWEALQGIGEKIAQRIIKYKDLLGGFYSIQQIREVYGISDSLFQAIEKNLIVEQSVSLNLINLNESDFKILARHPYIRYELAKWILNYKKTNGQFHKLEEIKKADFLTEQQFEKLKPYLKPI